MSQPPLLTILVPLYNERYTLREIIRRVLAVDLSKEILIVDDGSSDGSRQIAEALAREHDEIRLLVHETNRGKGAAIRTGIASARGEFLVVQDADLEYNPAELPLLLAPLLAGRADVVYGSRFMAGPRRLHLFWHMVANKLLTLLASVVTNLNLTDMETCYKLFRTAFIKQIPLRSDGFGFEPEVTVKLARLGARIYEVPISYSGRDYTEGKKIGFVDAVAAVFIVLKYAVVSDVGEVGHHTLARMAELSGYNRELLRTFEKDLGRSVLDLGAGVGNISRYLLDRDRAVLADHNEGYLMTLRREFGGFENVEVVQLDLDAFRAPEIARLHVDSVVCFNVLEHIRDDERVLRELARGLPDGASLALVVPAHQSIHCALDEDLGHFRRYDRDELTRKLRAAGFEPVRIRYFNWVGAIGWFVFGKVLRRRHISRVATRGFRLVSWLRKLEEGRDLKFGLSVIALARRVSSPPTDAS